MKFINEEDLTEENFAKAWQEIEDIREENRKNRQLLNESSIPQFKSIEEAMQYYNAIPFAEWENKMFEKYGVNGCDNR